MLVEGQHTCSRSRLFCWLRASCICTRPAGDWGRPLLGAGRCGACEPGGAPLKEADARKPLESSSAALMGRTLPLWGDSVARGEPVPDLRIAAGVPLPLPLPLPLHRIALTQVKLAWRHREEPLEIAGSQTQRINRFPLRQGACFLKAFPAGH